ncbi:MAG: MnhB domain-containing protein [Peptococcales bacterium]|jgi:multicomponent Na+:H+ antiporter subunit B
MKMGFTSIVLDTAFRVLVPFTLVYGLYVLIFGEYGPGGGFQAGALLAVGVLLSKMIQGKDALFNISGTKALILAGIGTFVYALVGFITVFMGGKFLEYERLPLPVEELVELHPWGILGIEIGVTLCVMATIITIFSTLTGEEGPFND